MPCTMWGSARGLMLSRSERLQKIDFVQALSIQMRSLCSSLVIPATVLVKP